MNWGKAISELEASGLTQSEIADTAGCSQAYISQLKTGARNSPDFDIGKAIVDLHEGRCQKRKARPKEARAA